MAAKVAAPVFINSMVLAMMSADCSSSVNPPNWLCQRSKYCFARASRSGGLVIVSWVLIGVGSRAGL